MSIKLEPNYLYDVDNKELNSMAFDAISVCRKGQFGIYMSKHGAISTGLYWSCYQTTALTAIRLYTMKVEISSLYGMAVIETVVYSLVMTWMGIEVSRARRKYKVKYPTAYENKENSVFNRYQRAHQNAVENASSFYVALLIAAVHKPVGAAIGGAVYIVGRIVYSIGYYNQASQRIWGEFHGTSCTFGCNNVF